MVYTNKAVSFSILAALLIPLFMTLGASNALAGANPCSIDLILETIPENDTPFNYTVSGDQSGGFDLFDPSGNETGFGMGIDESVTITQETPPGWTLLGIECIEGTSNCGADGFEPCLTATVVDNTVTFFCEDNDTASCTFLNAAQVTPSSIPTLSEWGLIAMAGVLGIMAFLVLRRRRAPVS